MIERRMPHGLGLLGCGAFGAFVADATTEASRARLVAVADRDPTRATAVASRHDATAIVAGLDDLLSHDEIDVVVIATPPGDHVASAVRCLDAGRHVLIEKPLALDIEGCRRVAAAARANERVVTVDHLLRFAPLVQVAARLLGVADGHPSVELGPVRRYSFENDATDEGLPADHWFWDPHQSGGIHVEHGVHFFDLASWFIGDRADSVQAIGTGLGRDDRIDTVCATATFGRQATATWYHSFSHPRRCEHQTMRIGSGTSEIVLDGWVPIAFTIDSVTTETGAESLAASITALAAELDVVVDSTVVEGDRCRARLSYHGADAKERVYRQCIVALVGDLLDAIDEGREPAVGVAAASAAVALAVAATEAASSGRTVPVPRLDEHVDRV